MSKKDEVRRDYRKAKVVHGKAVHNKRGIVVPHHRSYKITRPFLFRLRCIYNAHDAYKWLAFTAITLKILNNVNEEAQRKHEATQINATTAPCW